MYLPVAVVIIFSFNESRLPVRFTGFSLKWYQELLNDRAMIEALENSLVLGAASCLVSAVIGTLGAVGLSRIHWKTKGALEYISILPLMIPEIILGMVLMAFFYLLDMPFGMLTLLLGHTVFCVPYILMEVKARLAGMDPSLEDSIALVANYRVINGITNLMLGKSMNEEDVDSIKETGEKLLELAPNVRLIQDDNTQNALLNGEASVGFLYTSQVTAALAEYPELEVVYPEEGLGFGIMGMFIPSEAPNKEAAYQFMDYILQPEIAAQCTDFIGYYSTNKAADELVNPDLVVPDSVKKGDIVQNVSAEAEEQYSKNWTEFKAACD